MHMRTSNGVAVSILVYYSIFKTCIVIGTCARVINMCHIAHVYVYPIYAVGSVFITLLQVLQSNTTSDPKP